MKDQRALHRFLFKRYLMQNKLSTIFLLRCKLRFDAKGVVSFLVIQCGFFFLINNFLIFFEFFFLFLCLNLCRRNLPIIITIILLLHILLFKLTYPTYF